MDFLSFVNSFIPELLPENFQAKIQGGNIQEVHSFAGGFKNELKFMLCAFVS